MKKKLIKFDFQLQKLKPRDIARFIITYKGELNSQLNKPVVDSDKACARLLLHKSLQLKYKTIKNKFGDIPIKDLLMSRQERRKLKKEAKDEQKNKKKRKEGKVVNSEGDWNVEEVELGNDSKEISQNDDDTDDGSDDGIIKDDGTDDGNQNDDDSNDGNQDDGVSNNGSQDLSDDDIPITRQVVNDSDESSEGEQSAEDDDQDSIGVNSDGENMEKQDSSYDDQGQNDGSDEEKVDTGNIVKLKPLKQTKPETPNFLIPKPVQPVTANVEKAQSKLKPKKKPDNKVKENKNKNLNEKMLNRKFKKDADDSQNAEKVVDPFFKTATGESYMSVAEPRQPDEVKEVHMQGNRQERRATMFGRAPIKPRRNDRQNFRTGNFDNRNGKESNGKFKFDGNDRRSKFNDRNSFNNRNSNYNDNDSKFNDRSSNFNGRNSNFNDNNSKFNDRNPNFSDRNSKFNDKIFNNNKVTEPKEEKLHPSWEAKKKQSGILPFKGKKIVFDES